MAKKARRVRLDWVPLDVSFPRGRKAVALGIATENPLAWAHVILLWTWAAENAREGSITGPDSLGVIEQAAGWTGTKGALVESMALPHIRLLDELSNGYRIHDWEEHTGRHIVSAQKKAEHNAKRQEEWRLRNALHNTPVTPEYLALEGEGEGKGEEPLTTHTRAREAGAADREAIEAKHPRNASPLTDDVVKALRAAGKTPAYPSPSSRASVEAAIAGVGVPLATTRIVAAWSDAKPWLTFYLEAITGQNGVKKPARGMATPSTDFTSPEHNTL